MTKRSVTEIKKDKERMNITNKAKLLRIRIKEAR